MIYSFDRGELPVYVGQQMDVFIEVKNGAEAVRESRDRRGRRASRGLRRRSGLRAAEDREPRSAWGEKADDRHRRPVEVVDGLQRRDAEPR